MIRPSGFVFFVGLVAMSFGCLPRRSKTGERVSPVAAVQTNVPTGVGNGLSLAGTGFVWEKSDLPLCYSERAGISIFVWKEQSTFACNKGQKEWQVAANGR